MVTPLLTFQILACWVSDTWRIGGHAWSPPGDLLEPTATTWSLDQRPNTLPVTCPPTPARAKNLAWQLFTSSTSPVTWDERIILNLPIFTELPGHDTAWRRMVTPLLTLQILACWVADTWRIGGHAWSPPGDLLEPTATTWSLDQRPNPLPVTCPPTPARAKNLAWQLFTSSTSPVTWDERIILNRPIFTELPGHDTAWHRMVTPLLTLKILACWVADTWRIGGHAWSPPGDLLEPTATTWSLDQRPNPLPVTCPPTPARAKNLAWQLFTSSTSPVTWDERIILNRPIFTELPGHDTAWRRMVTPLLTLQVGYLSRSKQYSTNNYFLIAVSCPCDFKLRNLLCLCCDAFTLQLLSELMLLLSGDVELNPGPTKAQIESVSAAIKQLDETILAIRADINQLKAVQTNHETVLSTLTNRISLLESAQTEPSLNTAPHDAVSIKHEIETLKAANTDANNRLRRNNLLFLGIEDSAKETWDESEQNVMKFCTDHLGITLETNSIERAHRIGKFSADKKRPIVIKLAHFKTKEKILSCGPNLKETTFAVREDFAAATRIARAKLLKFIRPQKCAFKLRVDKLIVGNKSYFYDPKTDSVKEFSNSRTNTLETNSSDIPSDGST
ncbi:uncharacterized protein LOC144148372 [Haemaphysalis longicornis]